MISDRPLNENYSGVVSYSCRRLAGLPAFYCVRTPPPPPPPPPPPAAHARIPAALASLMDEAVYFSA